MYCESPPLKRCAVHDVTQHLHLVAFFFLFAQVVATEFVRYNRDGKLRKPGAEGH